MVFPLASTMVTLIVAVPFALPVTTPVEELTEALGSSDRGILEGDSIYIINNSEVPVALLEIGFMTNTEELKLLNSPEYQQKTAEAIYKAVFKALEEISLARSQQ